MNVKLIPPNVTLALLPVTFREIQVPRDSECNSMCINTAVRGSVACGQRLTDSQCVCTNVKLHKAVLTCILENCTVQDFRNFEDLECSTTISSGGDSNIFESPPITSSGSSITTDPLPVGPTVTIATSTSTSISTFILTPASSPSSIARPSNGSFTFLPTTVGNSVFVTATPTSALPSSRSHLGIGAVVGISLFTGALVMCLLLLGLFSYLKLKQHTHPVLSACVHRFTAGSPLVFQRSPESMDSDTLLVFGSQQHVVGLENRIFSPSSTGSANAWDDWEFGPYIFGPQVEHPRSYRYEADGGVRLAGGRPGEVVPDIIDGFRISDELTLPPLYSSHFGEAECV
ncbi:hypothetical protein V8D89_001396 [Ganoderma adspersum]